MIRKIAVFMLVAVSIFAAEGCPGGKHKTAEHGLQWPNATPPDKTDPYWNFNNNMNVNGIEYLKVEVSPGKWQWKVNEEAMKDMQNAENATWDLYYSLAKRKLSHDELMHVYEGMNTRNMQAFFQVDIDAALYDMLVKQWELQTGRPMEGYAPLSTAKGKYNRSPQEEDNKRIVIEMVKRLQEMTKAKRGGMGNADSRN